MEKFVKGDIVVVPFPFSDLSSSKRRPALVIVNLPGEDIILCQVTSQLTKDEFSISLLDSDFDFGGLKQQSNIRPNRIFTASKSIIRYRAGSVKPRKLSEVRNKIVSLLDQ
ncbi:MAG TPA: type II toxin-antitoxin system PemK/MazF family toxin [Cyclobacteriaceae bacterium]|nr:type II toxin-antitoxin system PemK/MazF family toxin [Cyclobacteriaceae bacterium]HRJ81125.1 type II toxin-antitoxin system PemK/MazF family toxin [Cyclobacteriaceae bacterium]